MHDLAITLRAAQLYTHNAHNVGSKGPLFHQDHEWFGSSYAAYEAAYDAIVERMVGLGYQVDLKAITEGACEECCSYSITSAQTCYNAQLGFEKQLCKLVAKYVPNVDDGTQNLLQGLADESLSRQYKINQRLGT